MIVKIFPAKGDSFQGVAYNDNKINQEKSDLMVAANFNGLGDNATRNDYVMYLQKHSQANTKIKKPQFHAAISGKGKETSFEELKKFAKHYMDKMGYGNNPYLIYKHTDTENNHVHIVSSRVDYEGNKINHEFERVRSQKVRSEYLGLDVLEEIEKTKKAIDKYHISNISQYKLLLEKNYNKVIEKPEHIIVYKSDKGFKISKRDIERHIESKQKNINKNVQNNRLKELHSYLLELSKEHTLEELKIIAKQKNVDIVVFKTKDKTRNFGYAVIDYKTKAVFKGSQIIPLKILENNKLDIDNKNRITETILKIIDQNTTLEQLNQKLKSINIEVDSNSKVYRIDGENKEHIQTLNKSLTYPLNYNSAVQYIKENYNPLSREDIKILAFTYKVKQQDIQIKETAANKIAQDDRDRILSNINSELRYYINNGKDTKEQYQNSSINLYKLGKQYYAIDTDLNFIGGIKLDNDVKEAIVKNGLFKELYQSKEFERYSPLNNKLETVLQGIEGLFHYEDDTNKKKSREKKNTKNY
tara:strand:- start:21848 stop:23434 length:1587 start_codon:yes stop_codon:yes gene_type:complete